MKFLFATSLGFILATVLEFFIHYQFLAWLFVFCLGFYLVFFLIKELKTSIFFITFGITASLFLLLYYYINIANPL